MGSRPTNEDLAYIAGFLDGDGSLMFQIKRRKDTEKGRRFMATIVFYQDTRHEAPLHWIQKKLKIGYLSRRSDGITEVRINGFAQVGKILETLIPYLRFKKPQAIALHRVCKLLTLKNISTLTQRDKKNLCDCIMKI